MIRRYRKEDYEEAKVLLAAEGVSKTALTRLDSITFVMEKKEKLIGLFVITIKEKIPVLQHFLIVKKARNKQSKIGFVSKNTLNLLQFFDFFIKGLGFQYFMINLGKRKIRVCRFVERYFKTRIKKIKESGADHRLYFVRTIT